MRDVKKLLEALKELTGPQPPVSTPKTESADDRMLGHLLDGIAASGDRTYQIAMINAAKPLFGFTPSGVWRMPEDAADIRAKIQALIDAEAIWDPAGKKAAEAMLAMLPEDQEA